MRILQPFDLSQVTIDSLLAQGKILPIQNNRVWQCSIFPISKDISKLNYFDKDHQITQVDDILFAGFTILDKREQIVLLNNNTARDYIKTIEIGDHIDSVKRYNQLDKPVDYSEDALTFLNIPTYDETLLDQLDVTPQLIHKPAIDIQDFVPEEKRFIFETPINHPHITHPIPKQVPFKSNDKKIIQEIFTWGKQKGIKYIYCINEYRPYVINDNYTTPYVYYTIRGAY